jgi:hypothetical protein
VAGGGASQGATNVEVEGTGPELGDDVGSLLQDLVMRSADASVLGSASPSDAAPAFGSSGATGPGVLGPYLLGSLGLTPPPINYRRVGMR